MMSNKPKLRSDAWFAGMERAEMTAVYIERYLNYGLTREELQSGKPIIGIAQTGNDLSPCNRIHLTIESRIRDGVRDAGGVPFVFPVHPIAENCRRPTAALDRNLAYLGLVEILYGYPIDGVVLTTGCDKTTPACLMAAATVNCPSIVLSGGPMLDAYWENQLAGSGWNIWEARRKFAAGEIDIQEVVELVAEPTPSLGHCNTMGTALSMNSLAEAMGMSLTGCAAIPAPYRHRQQMAFKTGQRIVDMVREELTPDKIITRKAIENAIVVNTAIGGSTNCPPHITAIARHAGIELSVKDWETLGYDIPLLVNCQPAGEYLGEAFFRAGGVPAVMAELLQQGKLHGDVLTVTGRSMQDNLSGKKSMNVEVIRGYDDPVRWQAGFLVLTGNLFDSAILKTSVISNEYRERYLSTPGEENCFIARCIVFDGPEDYHARINDPQLDIDETCMLVIRGCGPVGYPGSAEVVNMLPPDTLVQQGVNELACLGDGRQSGTSGCPAILNASPESTVGGNLAILRTGDKIHVDLNDRTVNVMISDDEIKERWQNYTPPDIKHYTPWQEIYRDTVGQLECGGCMELALKYKRVGDHIPRHNH